MEPFKSILVDIDATVPAHPALARQAQGEDAPLAPQVRGPRLLDEAPARGPSP